MEQPTFSTHRYREIPAHELTEIYRNPRIRHAREPKYMAAFLDVRHGTLDLRTLPYHHRSADLGTRHLAMDAHGHVFCQLDLKGTGFVHPGTFESRKDGLPCGSLRGAPEVQMVSHAEEEPWDYKTLGLMDRRQAEPAIANGELLNAAGVRCEAIAAVYGLSSIQYQGRTISVTDFKTLIAQQWLQEARAMSDKKSRQDMLNRAKDLLETFEPVIAQRLMRSVFRVRDFKDETAPAARRLMLEDACANLNAEAQMKGRRERFDPRTPEGKDRWLKQLVSWYGKNLGLMHTRGLAHIYLHMGNLTLAGEFVDLDSVVPILEKKAFTGRPEDKRAWLRLGDRVGGAYVPYTNMPFFHETPDGCYVSTNVRLTQADPRFGLPKPLVKDMRDLCFSIKLLVGEIRGLQFHTHADLAERLVAAYEDGLAEGSVIRDMGLDPALITCTFRQIANEVVGQGLHYPPIDLDTA